MQVKTKTKTKTGDEDFCGKDRYIALALETVVENRLNFNIPGVINYGNLCY